MPSLRLRSIIGARRGPESIFSGPRVRIGRSRTNDLILPDKSEPAAGSHHAEALLDSSGTWWIVDSHSANGTFVNGTRVGRQIIKTGDHLTFGDEQFVAAIGGIPARNLLGGCLLAVVVVALAAFAFFARKPAPLPSFESAAKLSAQSVFLIVIEENHRRAPIGTAFSIERPLGGETLVTNAHIASLLERRGAVGKGGAEPIALAIEGDTYLASAITATRIHPGWHAGSIEKDVALLQIQVPPTAPPLTLTAPAALQLNRGTPVAAFGFPAVSTDVAHPRARLTVDVVGDIRGDYIESGLNIAPGTSGSPVFDQTGTVVGIVAGGDFVGGLSQPLQPSGSAANWVLSASVVRELFK